ncbi:type I-D CRISPR-associated protein Cas5/Csc1 [Fischerella thermalis CCMEE 5273]|uniref:type I-D CRISPR-associated protein Cas5/Csc1 n=1 Tax=Fischerella thermalis TaxID=372787 RepID=UPI000C80E4CA|nr:type I-D CRISPR-associated protein Cas5/Csc1 [Fischerella thermalis]PMB07226.1 type I-D CRISPR-associated protein Cas5/Csc1 [Fischerella thermalis CCMEE 5273]PMB36718.1 type I-D CRISPR-associated protein Cas5/Csc1 [Fischerella thermalis BR2B]
MSFIYRCHIELHDSMYHATREIGRLYETEPIIHNYALCYALGLVDSEKYATTVSEEDSYRYFCPEQVPKYEQHLTPLNQQGIYVTPAASIHHTSILNTWKYANNNYHVEMEKTQKNIPSFGRAKEIAPESQFEFFVISQKELKLPKWIRLGKWMSKAEVTVEKLPEAKTRNDLFICTHPLNPLDVMFTNQVISYDVVNMPPVSLIQNVQMRGQYYYFEDIKELKIPVRMTYRFRG